nr:MAG TPA: hypothetical protein [Microviridae sp.]
MSGTHSPARRRRPVSSSAAVALAGVKIGAKRLPRENYPFGGWSAVIRMDMFLVVCSL